MTLTTTRKANSLRFAINSLELHPNTLTHKKFTHLIWIQSRYKKFTCDVDLSFKEPLVWAWAHVTIHNRFKWFNPVQLSSRQLAPERFRFFYTFTIQVLIVLGDMFHFWCDIATTEIRWSPAKWKYETRGKDPSTYHYPRHFLCLDLKN